MVAYIFKTAKKETPARVRVDLSEVSTGDPDLAGSCLRITSMTLDQIRALFDRLGEPSLRCKFLVKGTDAQVFELASGRVLKITRSKSDAEAFLASRKRPSPYVAKVYDVCQFPVKGRIRYAIVMDKLAPLPSHWDNFFGLFLPGHIALQRDPEAMLAALQESYPRYTLSDEQMGWVRGAFSHLSSLKIYLPDFHSGNLMMKGSIPQIIDMGGAKGPHPKISELESSTAKRATDMKKRATDPTGPIGRKILKHRMMMLSQIADLREQIADNQDLIDILDKAWERRDMDMLVELRVITPADAKVVNDYIAIQEG